MTWKPRCFAVRRSHGRSNWVDHVRAVTLLQKAFRRTFAGLMIGQNGMSSTVNAELPAALLGLKVADAGGDIRAHPTSDMSPIGMAGRSVGQVEPTWNLAFSTYSGRY